MLKKNILNRKDQKEYNLNFRRVSIVTAVLVVLIISVMVLNGANIYKGG